jgi:dCTP deaminase
MILSAQTIRKLNLLTPCVDPFKDRNGNSGGLGPCGYDLTLDEAVYLAPGAFSLASAVERFTLPTNVVGIIHDKSSLARRGLAVQNTVAEPGWSGYLTLELTNHSAEPIMLFSGSAVCQVIFHFLDEPTDRPYSGKYQNQERGPQSAR